MILACDPGTTESAYVLYEPFGGVQSFAKVPNVEMLVFLRHYHASSAPSDVLVVEQIANMGMPVGEEVMQTVFWSGRFVEAWDRRGYRWDRIKRVPVKVHLCGTAKAKDANVRQALIDRFGGPACIKKGGDLYKMSGDCWAALAVAVAYSDIAGAIAHGHPTPSAAAT